MRSQAEKASKFLQSLKTLVRVVGQRPTVREIETAVACRRSRHFSSGMALLTLREALFQIRKHDLNTKSAALTYSTILALGPLLGTALFFFQQFGGFDLLISKALVPLISSYFSTQVAEQLQSYLQVLIRNFKSGVFGGVAIVTFLFTIVGLLSGIEKAVNNIFSVDVHRPLWRQSLNYWLVLTLTPLILVFSTTKTGEFLSRFTLLSSLLEKLSFLGQPLTIVAQSLGFAFLFYILPNRRMPMKALLYGGFAAGILFRLLQYVNVFLTRNVVLESTAAQLYGTAPIIAVAFFFWIKLVWLVALAGACLSMAIMSIEETAEPRRDGSSPLDALLLCTSLFARVCDAFRKTGEGISAQDVALVDDVEPSQITHWLKWLERRRLIFSAEMAGGLHYFPSHHGLRLERDPAQFVEKILLARPGIGAEMAAPPAADHSPFVERVHAILRGGATLAKGNGEPSDE